VLDDLWARLLDVLTRKLPSAIIDKMLISQTAPNTQAL
jgi:hypothetical protein